MDLTFLQKNFGIALTGGIACGKSSVANILRQNNVLVIDADALSRLIVAPGSAGLRELLEIFGPTVLERDGSLNRRLVRQLVFADQSLRLKLEAIIHPKLKQEVAKLLLSGDFGQNPQLWFYEAALIYERQRASEFLAVWVVQCREAEQLRRLMARDQCSKATAEAMIASQMSNYEKAALADRVIDTECSRGDLEIRVRAALAEQLTSLHAK